MPAHSIVEKQLTQQLARHYLSGATRRFQAVVFTPDAQPAVAMGCMIAAIATSDSPPESMITTTGNGVWPRLGWRLVR